MITFPKQEHIQCCIMLAFSLRCLDTYAFNHLSVRRLDHMPMTSSCHAFTLTIDGRDLAVLSSIGEHVVTRAPR